MRRRIAKLPLLLLTLPLLLLASCANEDAGASGTPASAPQTAATLTAPTEAAIKGIVRIDFKGSPEELQPIESPFEVAPGSTAWEAIKLALGEENLKVQDFGGSLGIFISGFNGVEAEGNHFWELKINGEPAVEGVSKYEVQQGDVLEFVYSSF